MARSIASGRMRPGSIPSTRRPMTCRSMSNPLFNGARPGTAQSVIQDRLGIPTHAGALDFNLGCSGYVYGLGLAHGTTYYVRLDAADSSRITLHASRADALAMLHQYGMSKAQFDRFLTDVDGLTTEQANRLAKQHLPKDKLQFVLIGNASEIAPVAAKGFAIGFSTSPPSEIRAGVDRLAEAIESLKP